MFVLMAQIQGVLIIAGMLVHTHEAYLCVLTELLANTVYKVRVLWYYPCLIVIY